MSKVGEYYRELEELKVRHLVDNDVCNHDKAEYQPAEYETNVTESYTCENCGIDLPMPTPDCDL